VFRSVDNAHPADRHLRADQVTPIEHVTDGDHPRPASYGAARGMGEKIGGARVCRTAPVCGHAAPNATRCERCISSPTKNPGRAILEQVIPVPPILIVEDDVELANAIADTLVEEGYVVDIVPDGAAALGYLSGRPAPSMILLDLALPVIDGLELRRWQRSSRWHDVPVIVISASDAAAVAERMGALECLKKPFDREDLLRAVRGVSGPDEPSGVT
jgi:CheY-like chemotaxis protein